MRAIQSLILSRSPYRVLRYLLPLADRLSAYQLPDQGIRIRKDPVGSLLESGRSLIRWGDGETQILLGGGISFQRPNRKLRQFLFKILTTSHLSCEFELGLPEFPFLPNDEFLRLERFSYWVSSRYLLPLLLDSTWLSSTDFIDAHAFRSKFKTSADSPIDPSPLFNQSDSFALVANAEVISRVAARYPLQKVWPVAIPSANAFSSLSRVLEELDALYRVGHLRDGGPVLLSGGPLAKVIVFLRASRWQCLDLGHFHEHMH